MTKWMCIGNIDRCWEVIQDVWARCDAAEAAKAEKVKQRSCAAAAIYYKSLKRSSEEELSTEDMLSFSDLLVGFRHRIRDRGSSGLSGTFSSKRRMNWLRRIWIWI